MQTQPPALSNLAHIDTWVFDLDNTLYPAACDLFSQIDVKMGEFIMAEFKLDHTAAKLLQKGYFQTHGTTLRGLMLDHGMDPAPYLAFVHDIDLTIINQDRELDEALGALPGKKFVFTNADTPHAERVLQRLGIEAHFEGIFDVVASEYVPKPAASPYQLMLDQFSINPERAFMIEDIAANLIPAAALGMETLLLQGRGGWPDDVVNMAHVHHRAELLTPWLQSVTAV